MAEAEKNLSAEAMQALQRVLLTGRESAQIAAAQTILDLDLKVNAIAVLEERIIALESKVSQLEGKQP